MFWNFMTSVHGLPPFEKKDEQPWWTEEEEKILALVKAQLCYMRPEDSELPIYQDPSKQLENESGFNYTSFGPDHVKENGVWTLGLSEGYAKFMEEHSNLGKYIQTVTYSGWEEPQYICPDCFVKETGLDLDEDEDKLENLYEEQSELANDEKEYIWDVDGPGKVLGLSKDDVGDEYEFPCPVCGGKAREVMYDEGPDVEVVMVFENGSIAFAHYGRGAGISVRLHKNLPEWSKGQDPVAYFQELDYEGSGW